jgi:hypothetical protein
VQLNIKNFEEMHDFAYKNFEEMQKWLRSVMFYIRERRVLSEYSGNKCRANAIIR